MTLRESLTAVKLGPWVGVGFSVVFGLATLVWRSPVTSGSTRVVDVNFLVPAGMIAATGLLSMLVGYRFAPEALRALVNRADRDFRGRAPAEPSAVAVLGLWLIAVAAMAFQVRSGGFGYLADPTASLRETSSANAVLSTLTKLGMLGTFLAAWRHARAPKSGTRLSLVVVAGSQMGLGLFAAQKEIVIVHFIAIFLGSAIWRRPRFVSLVVAAVFVIAFVFPFVSQYRAEVDRGSSRLSPAGALANVDFRGLFDLSVNTSSSESARTASERLTRVGDVAVIVQKTPSQVPYRSATDLLSGPFLGLVPRSVWDEKPVLNAGYQMSSVYYGLPTSVHTSSALTPYGDLWRHGGLPIVVAGMLLTGVFIRTVDDRTRRSKDRSTGTSFYRCFSLCP